MGAISVTMLMSIIMLTRMTGIQYAENPATQLTLNGQPVGPSYVQETIIGQLSQTVFSGFPVGVAFISIVTGVILILAANTAFNGFPVLGSILAKDGYLPAPAAHPRRPARVLQRHPDPRRGRDLPDHRCTTPRSPS